MECRSKGFSLVGNEIDPDRIRQTRTAIDRDKQRVNQSCESVATSDPKCLPVAVGFRERLHSFECPPHIRTGACRGSRCGRSGYVVAPIVHVSDDLLEERTPGFRYGGHVITLRMSSASRFLVPSN